MILLASHSNYRLKTFCAATCQTSQSSTRSSISPLSRHIKLVQTVHLRAITLMMHRTFIQQNWQGERSERRGGKSSPTRRLPRSAIIGLWLYAKPGAFLWQSFRPEKSNMQKICPGMYRDFGSSYQRTYSKTGRSTHFLAVTQRPSQNCSGSGYSEGMFNAKSNFGAQTTRTLIRTKRAFEICVPTRAKYWRV